MLTFTDVCRQYYCMNTYIFCCELNLDVSEFDNTTCPPETIHLLCLKRFLLLTEMIYQQCSFVSNLQFTTRIVCELLKLVNQIFKKCNFTVWVLHLSL